MVSNSHDGRRDLGLRANRLAFHESRNPSPGLIEVSITERREKGLVDLDGNDDLVALPDILRLGILDVPRSVAA